MMTGCLRDKSSHICSIVPKFVFTNFRARATHTNIGREKETERERERDKERERESYIFSQSLLIIQIHRIYRQSSVITRVQL